MKCKKCKAEMTKDDVAVEIAAHDDNLLDIIVTCPECGHQVNDFMDVANAVDL
jgi:RNase P subunit RPR2